jgi:N-methylhydantoinase B
VAEEMGIVLQRAAFSPNITMRLDFSCALFDASGSMLAQAAHIPVHLGAMSAAMDRVIESATVHDGDVFILNAPYQGGTHLPDITLLSPVYRDDELLGYVMSRAHHADIGGMTPASMPLASEIFQEGLIIPPIRLQARGELCADVLALIVANVRTPEERRGDVMAQLAAQTRGRRRLLEIADRYGSAQVQSQASELIRYSEFMTRAMIGELPDGSFSAEDCLDDDGVGTSSIRLAVTIHIAEEAMTVDFSGCDDQVRGPVNAVEAVTRSALLYVIRTLLRDDVPVNDGMLRPVRLITRPGSVVSARHPAAVSAGNVETSQRIVDVLYRALAAVAPDRVPAASQGTMNNIAFGGMHPVRGRAYAYYETLGGGVGGRPDGDGASGFHDHMSNTMNTPVELLEMEYPVRVRRYCLRRNSGGRGRSNGGDGIVREFEFLGDATCTIMSERRLRGPYGLSGGNDGSPGRNVLISGNVETNLGPKAKLDITAGDILRIESPGGGGVGVPAECTEDRG